VSDRVTLAEAEDRLRRTLARRAGDVPPADDPVPSLGGELALVPTPGHRPRPRHRRHLVAAAASAAVAVAAAVGLGMTRGDETAEIVPVEEAPTTDPTVPPETTTPPGTPTTADPHDRRVQDLEDAVPTDPPLLPNAVAGFGQPGQEPDHDIWLYATYYPNPRMADAVTPGDTREDLTGTEVPAVLDVAGSDPAINVWLIYDDGVLGLHSGMVPHDDMVAMAQSVHRIPGTRDFTMTPPSGWERR
jgi:hypothetical protein